MSNTVSDAGEALVARLLAEALAAPRAKYDTYPDRYVTALERHVAEGLRVNVGLMAENAALRKRLT